MSMQIQNLRTVIWPLLNPDTGLFHCDSISWAELEKDPGCYSFAPVRAVVERAAKVRRYAFLRIEPSVPAWCSAPVEAFARLIQALGKEFGGERILWGVDVLGPALDGACDGENAGMIAQVFADAFPYAFLFAEAGSPYENLLRDNGRMGVIVTRETLSQYAESWRYTPLRMRVGPCDERAVQDAVNSHVSILEVCRRDDANAATLAGHRFEVRTVCINNVPDGVEASVTVTNAGMLPCYTDAVFHLRLCGSNVADACAFSFPGNARDIQPGDTVTLSRTLDVTGLQSGEYDVQVGLFCTGTEYPISFGIEGRISDGYYEGRMILQKS